MYEDTRAALDVVSVALDELVRLIDERRSLDETNAWSEAHGFEQDWIRTRERIEKALDDTEAEIGRTYGAGS